VVAPGQAAAGGLSFKGDGMDVKPGEAFRFSLCEGRQLKPEEVSVRCTKTNVNPKWVTGGHNANYVFNTGSTFLPRGVTLDGNGILSGPAGLDLAKTVVHICVLQLNETPGCDAVGFGPPKAEVTSTGPSAVAVVGAVGGAVAGGLTLGALLKKYQEGQTSGGSSGGGSCTTSQPSSCTSSSKCSCGYRCVTFDGGGGPGFCSP